MVTLQNSWTSVFWGSSTKYTKNRPPPVHTVAKKELVLILPFLGTTSWKVKNSLIRSFRKIMPFANLRLIFKTSKRLSSCFTFKDRLPKSLMSGVIYKFTCSGCNLRYIGSTKRFWETRLEEHTHLSARTGKPLNGCQIFAPLQHVKSKCCSAKSVTREDFTIIGRDSDPYVLQVKESIFVGKERPILIFFSHTSKISVKRIIG